MSSAQPAQTNTKANAPIDEDLPPQLHAGKVGYGPNYRTGPTLEEKVVGLKEELLGKVTHNKERIRHGHEVRSGEEKRKKMSGEDEPNPFAGAEEDHSLESPAAGLKGNKSHDQSNANFSEAGGKTPENTPASASLHSSTQGHSTSSAALNANQNGNSHKSLNSKALPSDVNQSLPVSEGKMGNKPNAADSDVNQTVPTSTKNKNMPTSTLNTNMPSAETNNNLTSHKPTNNNPFTSADSESDGLSRSSYKPSPENATIDLNDKKNKERAATVAPAGTEAAEHQRKGGNVTDTKYLN
ncbi:hypothetical protein CVT24_000032 [Panaeolus cyanescens]|uniref:Uncharacterized protein n=1 Tax=Panaeolus cyanescens TaxID=181874 RepID=A0A409VSD9_9AGAR|nr:hypothetical protein CVT24_000032 [Panaeolus cyanescens]